MRRFVVAGALAPGASENIAEDTYGPDAEELEPLSFSADSAENTEGAEGVESTGWNSTAVATKPRRQRGERTDDGQES